MYYYYYYCHSFLSELDISLLQGHLVRAGGGGGGGGQGGPRLPATGLGNEPELSEVLPFFSGRSEPGLQKAAENEPVSSFASHQSPFPRKHQIIRLLEKRNTPLLNLLMSETIKLRFYPLEGGGGEWGVFTKFYTGRLCPEVHPVNLLYTTLAKKVLLLNTFY